MSVCQAEVFYFGTNQHLLSLAGFARKTELALQSNSDAFFPETQLGHVLASSLGVNMGQGPFPIDSANNLQVLCAEG